MRSAPSVCGAHGSQKKGCFCSGSGTFLKYVALWTSRTGSNKASRTSIEMSDPENPAEWETELQGNKFGSDNQNGVRMQHVHLQTIRWPQIYENVSMRELANCVHRIFEYWWDNIPAFCSFRQASDVSWSEIIWSIADLNLKHPHSRHLHYIMCIQHTGSNIIVISHGVILIFF